MNAENDVPVSGEPELTDADAPVEAAEAEAEEEPLNRAARRARDKQAKPSHVGPRVAFGQVASRPGRPRTKRPQ